MFADSPDDVWDFALDGFGRPEEKVRQICGEVRHVDLRRVPVERDRLGFRVHAGNFQKGSSDSKHGRSAVVICDVVALHPNG